MKSLPISLFLSTTLAFVGGAPIEAQGVPVEMVTDSVTGTFVQRLPNGFILRTDAGEDMALEIASDTIQELQDLQSDSTATLTPHASVMDSRDVLFAIRQLEETEGRDRMHIHFYTLADPGRRVVVWMSIAEDRVPGGG